LKKRKLEFSQTNQTARDYASMKHLKLSGSCSCRGAIPGDVTGFTTVVAGFLLRIGAVARDVPILTAGEAFGRLNAVTT